MTTYPGLDIAIPWDGDPDPSLPWADDIDDMLVPGSFLLLDPAHASDPMAGVPAANALVVNHAWRRIAAVRGEGTRETLGFTLHGGSIPNVFRLERSTKGALYGVMSQTQNTQNNQGAYIQANGLLVQHLKDHATESVYVSRWRNLRRAAKPGSSLLEGYVGAPGFVGTIANFTPAGMVSHGTIAGRRAEPADVQTMLGWQFEAVEIAAGARSADLDIIIAQWGNMYAFNDPGNYGNRSASYAIARAFGEFTSLSGRSFAELVALDLERFQEDTGPGGRFHGDQYPTDPAALP